jgi:hypothetical protein
VANTLPDVTLTSAYLDLYAATGITPGKALLVQNKASSIAYVQIKGFQPASSSLDGVLLPSYEFCIVDANSSGVWAKGSGKVSVQELI